MTVEDRLRATTEAITGAMRPLRPLDLPPGADHRKVPARPRRPRLRGGWRGRLIPLAAAVAVITVAATLVTVRGLSGAGSGSRPTPAATSTSSNGMPRYYVAISYTATSPKGGQVQNAYLADTSTGKHLATFKPASDAMFASVAASSDDKTFVLRALAGPSYGPSGSMPKTGLVSRPVTSVWYVLRLTPGAAQQARLTRVPIASSFRNDSVEGLAVSPDGRTLAITFRKNGGTSSGFETTLQTYSLATGQVLRTWTGSVPGVLGGLTWLDDGHTLTFTYPTLNYPTPTAPGSIRALNTAGPGTSLIADSRPVFSVPDGAACTSVLMTSDGKAVICGSTSFPSERCTGGTVDLAAYSVATGKLERVLYRFPGACRMGGAQVLWAKSSTLAIAEIVFTKPVAPYPQLMDTVGVVPPGKPASLPVHLGETYDGPGTIAF